MLSHTHREAGTWPIAFVNYSMLTRLWTHPDAAPQLIFSMWKRSTLAYFLLLLFLVPHPSLRGDLHTIYEVVQIGEACCTAVDLY